MSEMFYQWLQPRPQRLGCEQCDRYEWYVYESSFNQDLSAWDVSNVTNMSLCFHVGNFNQDLSAWDVSNVTTMSEMFNYSGFNQDLSRLGCAQCDKYELYVQQ